MVAVQLASFGSPLSKNLREATSTESARDVHIIAPVDENIDVVQQPRSRRVQSLGNRSPLHQNQPNIFGSEQLDDWGNGVMVNRSTHRRSGPEHTQGRLK